MDGEEPAISDEAPMPDTWPTEEAAAQTDEGLWSRSRDFDWGD